MTKSLRWRQSNCRAASTLSHAGEPSGAIAPAQKILHRAEPPVTRMMVATDRSETADCAVRWAASVARALGVELLLLQIIVPPRGNEGISEETRVQKERELRFFAIELDVPRIEAAVVVHADPSEAMLQAVEDSGVDVLVVGNVGMRGRKTFLLGNIPNRISHRAPCTVIIVNTVDRVANPHGGSARNPERETVSTSGRALFARAVQIARTLRKFGVHDLRELAHPQDEEAARATARRLREALDELGPTFAKVGQVLSTRPDLLPRVCIEELSSLQEHVAPLTDAEVVSVMEDELGVPWEDLFRSIDPEPLAAGTIAQVHRATLETGERVVVKVQRPNAEREILRDLALLERLAAIAARHSSLNRVFDIPAIVEHLSTSLRRELDFLQEASNLVRMKDLVADFTRLDVPQVYRDISTRRLLVIQEIPGVPLLQAPAGSARTEAARQMIEAFSYHMLEVGFFHADPHPGNMKWWNDTVYLLDLGMVGELDDQTRELMILLMLAFAEKDTAFLTEVVLALAGPQHSPDIDYARLLHDLDELVSRYRDLSLQDIQLGPLFQEVTQVAVAHGVPMPASLALSSKSLAQMQLAAAEMDPSLDPFSVVESYLTRRLVRQLAHGISPQQLVYESQKARLRVTRLLQGLEGVLGAPAGERLQIKVRGDEHLETMIRRAGRQLTMGFVMSGILAGVGSAVATVLLRARSRPA